MKKSERKEVYDKTKGRCAYCGCDLPENGWHLDHVNPIFRGRDDVKYVLKGADHVDNALPACARCNRWKATMTVDEFREEIEAQVARLRRDSAAFRLAEDYRQVAFMAVPVVFYFEGNMAPAKRDWT
ncbi:MAG: HNH endonuclease [Spartobacteria bacterium]|nr:HNH endonuclease [Spartobacteria bacterium]